MLSKTLSNTLIYFSATRSDSFSFSSPFFNMCGSSSHSLSTNNNNIRKSKNKIHFLIANYFSILLFDIGETNPVTDTCAVPYDYFLFYHNYPFCNPSNYRQMMAVRESKFIFYLERERQRERSPHSKSQLIRTFP